MIMVKFTHLLRNIINKISIMKLRKKSFKVHRLCNTRYDASIYGYNFTQKNIFDTYQIIPNIKDNYTIKKHAADSDYYNLTGFLKFNDNFQYDKHEFLFNLQAVLSFIDQRDVLIIQHKAKVISPIKIAGNRLSGGGEVIGKDIFFPESRKLFIEKSIQTFYNSSDNDLEIFKSAFFKTIEVFRARKNFIEISYFLLFSALESLSRAKINDLSSNSATVITNYLQEKGFNIQENNITDLKRATSSY